MFVKKEEVKEGEKARLILSTSDTTKEVEHRWATDTLMKEVETDRERDLLIENIDLRRKLRLANAKLLLCSESHESSE